MISSNHRFHGRTSLTYAYKRGTAVRHPQLVLRCALNQRRSTYRVAVVVSKKVAKSAVVRNRIRRRIYEAVRDNSPAIAGSYDLVFTVFSAELAIVDAPLLRGLVTSHLKKAGVIAAQNGSERAIVKTKGKG